MSQFDDLTQRTELWNDNNFFQGELTSDYHRGQRLDTRVELEVDFWIAGNMVEAFKDQLDKLLKEFAI